VLYLSNELTGEDDAIYSGQAGGGILPLYHGLYSHIELEGLLVACQQIMASWHQDDLAVTQCFPIGTTFIEVRRRLMAKTTPLGGDW
jgi:hypothetical protein